MTLILIKTSLGGWKDEST